MSPISKIEQALAIVKAADAANDWPVLSTDPEVNFLVDQMISGWEDLLPNEKEVYVEEVAIDVLGG